jgi:hypothetical protein
LGREPQNALLIPGAMAFAQARAIDCPTPEGDPHPPLTTPFRINEQEAGSEVTQLGGGFREREEG